MRKCAKCGVVLAASEFFAVTDRRSGLSSWCRMCERARQRAWGRAHRAVATAKARRYRRAHPEKADAREFARGLRRHYGLTVEQYDAMVVEQSGVCLICMKPPRSGKRLSVDHDHATGEVRGLLCHVCNQGLGYFYDDPELLRLAAAYLLRHCPVVGV